MESFLKFWGAMWLVVGILSFVSVLGTHNGGFGSFLTAIAILLCTVAPYYLIAVRNFGKTFLRK